MSAQKFKQNLLHMVGFEYPHHLMVSPPLNLIDRSLPHPKILRQKVKSNHSGDSNEPPPRNVKLKRLSVRPSDIKETSDRWGQPFVTDAQDYFIAGKDSYPWSEIPDFVVGRVGFDNWLVSFFLLLSASCDVGKVQNRTRKWHFLLNFRNGINWTGAFPLNLCNGKNGTGVFFKAFGSSEALISVLCKNAHLYDNISNSFQ